MIRFLTATMVYICLGFMAIACGDADDTVTDVADTTELTETVDAAETEEAVDAGETVDAEEAADTEEAADVEETEAADTPSDEE